ncbi:MAG: hypothetical protein NVS2B16_06870 [Chloroflexota bacterium]
MFSHNGLPREPDYFLERLAALQARIRSRLVALMREVPAASLMAVSAPREGDTIFGIDVHAEDVVHDFFATWGEELPLLLIAEGSSGDGGITYPQGTPRDQVAFTCIVDPIDGTRGLMYGKRSGWALSGVAPAPRGELPTLRHIQIAMQTELPTPRSHLSDVMWAVSGEGAHAETQNLESGARRSFQPQPSTADSLLYGFGTVTKFFPGTKVLASEIEEKLALALFGPAPDGNPRLFDDEYICTGGQLYELTMGHDRFIADLRPILQAAAGLHRICSHPYDLCTELIARESGVEVTDTRGQRLNDSLDIRTNCGWIGYGSKTLRAHIEPVLFSILSDMRLIGL